MGCDIQWFTEIRTPDGRWVYIDELKYAYEIRDYALFGKLGNSLYNKDDYKVFSKKRIPDDISERLKNVLFDYIFESGGFDVNYLTLDEMQGVDWGSEVFHDFLEKLKELMPDPKNIRCIYYFDN